MKYCIISPIVSCYISSQFQTILGLNISTHLSIQSAKFCFSLLHYHGLQWLHLLRNVAQKLYFELHPESLFSIRSDSTETHDGWLLAVFLPSFLFVIVFCYVVLVADPIQPRLTLYSQQFSCLTFWMLELDSHHHVLRILLSFNACFSKFVL